MKTLFVSFGSNLGDREAQIRQAAAMLAERIGKLRILSSIIETRPWGFVSPHLFCNAAAIYDTQLTAEEILLIVEDVERQLGRMAKTQHSHYADRAIDIDLLALDEEIVNSPRLTLPHAHIAQRRFVLEPLVEIASEAVHPVLKKTYAELLAMLNVLQIEKVMQMTDDIVAAFTRLIPQLSQQAVLPTTDYLLMLISTNTTHLYVGRDEAGQICATYTLCICPSPTGAKAWLEDVVVDELCRGRGYGAMLVEHAICEARLFRAKSLNLTSQPHRVAANSLYQKMGFKPRETNLYRFELS